MPTVIRADPSICHCTLRKEIYQSVEVFPILLANFDFELLDGSAREETKVSIHCNVRQLLVDAVVFSLQALNLPIWDLGNSVSVEERLDFVPIISHVHLLVPDEVVLFCCVLHISIRLVC